jgi:hypothetical protein
MSGSLLPRSKHCMFTTLINHKGSASYLARPVPSVFAAHTASLLNNLHLRGGRFGHAALVRSLTSSALQRWYCDSIGIGGGGSLSSARARPMWRDSWARLARLTMAGTEASGPGASGRRHLWTQRQTHENAGANFHVRGGPAWPSGQQHPQQPWGPSSVRHYHPPDRAALSFVLPTAVHSARCASPHANSVRERQKLQVRHGTRRHWPETLPDIIAACPHSELQPKA